MNTNEYIVEIKLLAFGTQHQIGTYMLIPLLGFLELPKEDLKNKARERDLDGKVVELRY